MQSSFILVDCNNFFVSCERVFNPKLKNKPVIVLSCNDGCAVARSNEAKALGIKMGVPAFECRDIIQKNNVQVFSSNFPLYADMSERVREVLKIFCDNIEFYSIDEAFLLFREEGNINLNALGKKVRQTVLDWTGIPVSLGIGPTKTLAKIANRIAKVNPTCRGIFNIANRPDTDFLLSKIAVGDVWGIGRRYAHFLAHNNIKTALDLKTTCDKWIKKHLHLPGLKTASELRGISCFPLEQTSLKRKNIIVSRSFGKPVNSLSELEEAVSDYATRASEKMRLENSSAGSVLVYIGTNRFKKEPQYFNSVFLRFEEPTNYTPKIISLALLGLKKIYKNCYNYKKAGVILGNFSLENFYQTNLFINPSLRKKKNSLMRSVDVLNNRFGEGTVRFATTGYKKEWKMRQNHRSQNFTTSWEDILKVSIN